MVVFEINMVSYYDTNFVILLQWFIQLLTYFCVNNSHEFVFYAMFPI